MLYSTAKYNYFFTNIQVFFTELSRSTDFLSRSSTVLPNAGREKKLCHGFTRIDTDKEISVDQCRSVVKISGVPGETVAFFKSFRYTG